MGSIGTLIGAGLGGYAWLNRRELNGETKLIVGIALALGFLVDTAVTWKLVGTLAKEVGG